MSARNYVETFAVGETKKLPGGRYFMVRTAAAVLDLETEGNRGTPAKFTGIGAGSTFGPVDEDSAWTFLKITSASAQIVEVIISDDGNFAVANAVTVTGGVTTAELPSAAVASPVAVTFATASASTIAANLSRRRITISALDTNAGILYVQAVAAGAGRGYGLQPGMTAEFRTTAALDVRNDTGAAATFSTFEES